MGEVGGEVGTERGFGDTAIRVALAGGGTMKFGCSSSTLRLGEELEWDVVLGDFVTEQSLRVLVLEGKGKKTEEKISAEAFGSVAPLASPLASILFQRQLFFWVF